MNSTKRICLWSGPRNISTALMYSFGNRADTAVVDEPFYGYYLANSKASDYHPSAQEIIQSMECDGQKVIEQLLSMNSHDIFFIKNMPHHVFNLPLEFLAEMEHLLLIREPEAMVRSFAKVIEQPQLEDFGYLDHLKLIEELKKRGLNFYLLDSKEVLANPEKRLRQLCSDLEIPFSNQMLSWKAGPRKEDGIWAKHWYKNVHQSNSFQSPAKSQKETIPEYLHPLVNELNPLYQAIIDSQKPT